MSTEFPVLSEKQIEADYAIAKERYASIGVDTDAAINRLLSVPVSMHCWQGDDVSGFEHVSKLTGGILTTGNYLGKARTPDELRQDADKAFSLIPGVHKFNLHAIYLEASGKVPDRDEIRPEHFQNWVAWVKSNQNPNLIGLDFNPTYFSHPKSIDGLTLSHPNQDIRKFWVEHGKRCSEIASGFARQLGNTVVDNTWIPDGYKNETVNLYATRERLAKALDDIFAETGDPQVKEAVESKLFGIGSESSVVGSSEFYLGYAITRNKLLCMDMGHYHPGEKVDDKISAVLQYMDKILLHVSRPVHWDSDHIVTYDDKVRSLGHEIARANLFDRVYLATDFFDASVNRIGAWVTGQRSLYMGLLSGLLEPTQKLRELEADGRGAEKIALMEAGKMMPIGAVYNRLCQNSGVPDGTAWINEIRAYEKSVLAKRV